MATRSKEDVDFEIKKGGSGYELRAAPNLNYEREGSPIWDNRPAVTPLQETKPQQCKCVQEL